MRFRRASPRSHKRPNCAERRRCRLSIRSRAKLRVLSVFRSETRQVPDQRHVPAVHRKHASSVGQLQRSDGTLDHGAPSRPCIDKPGGVTRRGRCPLCPVSDQARAAAQYVAMGHSDCSRLLPPRRLATSKVSKRSLRGGGGSRERATTLLRNPLHHIPHQAHQQFELISCHRQRFCA
jgi:hypothetical protein